MIVRELITKIGFAVDGSKLKEADFAVGKFKKKANDLTGNLKQAATGIRNVGVGLTAALTLPILGLGFAAVKSAADIEMLTTDFETLLGSAEKGSKLVDDIRNMASKTPFGTTDLAKASKTLLAFGVDSEKTLPILSRIGDVATGNKDRMKSLSLVYGQVTAAQRLMGQDLLQFINAGFNPLLEISERTGESMASLKDRMSKGEIGIDQVKQAFVDATSEGGRFFGGMERGSRTLQGRISTLKDVFLELLASFGDVALPALKAITTVLTEVARVFSDMPTPIKVIIGVIAGLLAVIGPLLVAGGQLAIMFLTLAPFLPAIATGFAAVIGPIGWIILAVGALTTAGVLLIKKWEPIKDFFTGIFNSISRAIGAVAKFSRFLGAKFAGVDVPVNANINQLSTDSSILGVDVNKLKSANGSRGTTQNINMTLDSKVEVPAGTPADIENYANTTVKKTVEKKS